MMHFVEKLIGLPELASQNGAAVDRLMVLMHFLMGALFVGWSLFFLFVLWRYRQSKHPRAEHVGVTSHFSSYLEVAVAIFEIVLLVGISIPVWSKAVDKFPPEDESVVIHVIGQQFAWNAIYPGTNGVFGRREMRLATPENKFGFLDPNTDPAGADDFVVVNDLKVPVNKPVIIHVSSLDVIHCFKVLPLRITQDAIPGMSVPLHFIATKTGSMPINCAQLCGLGHYSMRGRLTVVTQKEYDQWVADKVGAPRANGFE